MTRSIWNQLKAGHAPRGWSWLNRCRVVTHPDYRALLQSAALDSIPGMIQCQMGRIILADRLRKKNEVRRLEVTHEGRTCALYLKRYFNYSAAKILQRAFRGAYFPPSVVRAEFENLDRLRDWGVPTPLPVAYGEHRFAGAVINAFLITLEIPQAMGLDHLFHLWLPRQTSETQRQCRSELIRHLADTLRLMHEHGFEHHDLFFRNLMVSNHDFTRLFVLDTPRGRRWPRWFMRFRRAHDLASLDAAASSVLRRSERLAFFLRYRGRPRLGPSDKRLVRDILARANPNRQRQNRRLQRLVAIDAHGDGTGGTKVP